jgi:hypothetical protein
MAALRAGLFPPFRNPLELTFDEYQWGKWVSREFIGREKRQGRGRKTHSPVTDVQNVLVLKTLEDKTPETLYGICREVQLRLPGKDENLLQEEIEMFLEELVEDNLWKRTAKMRCN